MSSRQKTLGDLFLHGLQDIHFAHKHLAKTLSKSRSSPVVGAERSGAEQAGTNGAAGVSRSEPLALKTAALLGLH